MGRVLTHLRLGQRQLAVRVLIVAIYRLKSDGGAWPVAEG